MKTNDKPNISMSESALTHIKQQLSQNTQCIGIRFSTSRLGCSGWGYDVQLLEQAKPDDMILNMSEGVKLFIDPHSLKYLQGTHMDYVQEGLNKKFEFTNPNAKAICGCGESFSVDDNFSA